MMGAHWDSTTRGRRPVNQDEKDRKAALVAAELGRAKQKQPRRYRKMARTKKEKAEAERRVLSASAAPLLAPATTKAERPEPPELSEVAEIQRAIEERRLRWMAQSVRGGALDPSSLRERDSLVTLPPEVLDLIEKNDFTKEDLQACMLSIGRDNLAEFAALLKDKDPRVKLEAMRLMRDIVYGDKKTVEHQGQGGGPMQLVVKLVAPDGRERTLDRPKLEPA